MMARRSDTGDRGATLVEAAVATPVVALLLFGLVELVLLTSSRLTLGDITAEAARAGSVAGASDQADQIILQSVADHVGYEALDRIELVVIYRSKGDNQPPHPSCMNHSDADFHCNRYTADVIGQPWLVDGAVNPVWGCGPGTSDGGWCPTSRQSFTANGDMADHLSVYIRMVHKSVTGVPSSGWTLSDVAETTIEP